MRKKLPLVIIIFFSLITSICSQKKIDSLQQVLVNTNIKETKLKILDKLTSEMVRSNHSEQWEYLNQTISLAKELENYDLAVSKSRFIAQKYIYGGQADSAIYVVEELLEYREKFTTPKSEGHLLLKRGAAYFNKELLKKAVKDYDKSAALFMTSGDSIFAADAYYFSGQVYTNLKNFLRSVKQFETAYKLYDVLGDKVYANYARGELASLYGRNKFYDKAITERKKTLFELHKIKNYEGIATAYIQLGGNFLDKKEFEVAKKYIDTALYFSDSIIHKVKKARLKTYAEGMNLEYYLAKNNLIKAKEHFDLLEAQVKLTDSPEYYSSVLALSKALYYKKTKQYNKTEELLKKIIAKKDNINNVDTYVKAEKELAQLYVLKKQYIKAYKHHEKYIKSKETLEDEIKTNTFLYYQSHFETERKDNEIYKKETQIKLLEKDTEIAKAKRKALLIVLFAIILIAALIIYFIWKQGVRKRKALSKKIERNKKELSRYTKQLIEKSKIQELLNKEIDELKEEIGQHKSLEKLQDLTTVKILTNDDWYAFKEKFRSVYPNFFAGIKNKGFELTKAEERLIAMEKLYLDTNEIASMLAISQDSVTRSRSRLRKKINAPKGVSILDYLEAS